MRLLLAMVPWLLVLPLHAQAVVGPCSALFEDPKDDVVFYRQVPTVHESRPSVDIRAVNLTLFDGYFEYALTLGDRPGTGEVGYNRYWLGFYVDGGHGPEYMDVRIGSTSTYDEGWLVGTNRLGNPDWGIVPIAWNGSTMSFRMDVAVIQAHFPRSIQLGYPEAGSDGPSLAQEFQGAAAGAVLMDAAPDGVEEFQPLVPCMPSKSTSPGNVPPQASSATPLALLVVMVLAIAHRKANSGAP